MLQIKEVLFDIISNKVVTDAAIVKDVDSHSQNYGSKYRRTERILVLYDSSTGKLFRLNELG